MSKPIPQISKYMTTSPHSIGQDQTLATARALMEEHGFRHLPVLEAGKLIGVVSLRDIQVIESLRDVDPKKNTVEDAMTTEVYSVAPDVALDVVAAEMAERKYGCTIVMQNAHVVGVFTTVDACRALHDLLHGRLSK